MKVEEKTQQLLSDDDKELSSKGSKPLTSDLKIDLNLVEKSDDNSIENFLEDDESLRYDKTYKPILTDYKKSSTLSTATSQGENAFDSFSSKKLNINQESGNDFDNSTEKFFGRDRFYSTPVTNYFEGIDNYFKGLNPEKNDYQKSNNYLQKQIFLRDHSTSFDLNILKKEENKIPQKIQQKLSIDITRPPLTPQSQTSDFNKNCGKYEFPIYYFGYYSVDSKSKFSLL